MLAALAAVTFLRPGPSVADFFPLVPGTLRTFQEQGVSNTVTVDEVGQPVDVGGKPAVPVKTREGTKLVNTTYYRIDGNTVYIVAYDPKHPLPDPMPVLQLD